MYGLAVQARTRGDEQKLSDTLSKLAAEDPSFQVEHSTATRETVIRGLGELHLRMMLERMKERYHVEVETRPPRIPYRETSPPRPRGTIATRSRPAAPASSERSSCGSSRRGRGEGFEFVRQRRGRGHPSQFVPAVEKGIRQVLESGAIAGYRIDDVKVTVYDGKHHPVDSKEIAFVMAGKKGVPGRGGQGPAHRARAGGGPGGDGLPQSNMGDIAGDLSASGGGSAEPRASPADTWRSPVRPR